MAFKVTVTYMGKDEELEEALDKLVAQRSDFEMYDHVTNITERAWYFKYESTANKRASKLRRVLKGVNVVVVTPVISSGGD